ncbi:MAG: restriction endonuclease [Proteobacteria bacterium]|nr:restriction endonuclease [Pseudomonadota bacterium]
MTTIHLVPDDVRQTYEVYEWRNAAGVLATAHPQEWAEIVACLRAFKFSTSEVVAGGKNKSALAIKFDNFLTSKGWKETQFKTVIKVDDDERASPTHKVDSYKNGVALEIEWNNKDPFFDRDLNNFRLLFELRVIDVGIIVTRCSELSTIFKKYKINASYGMSTTHIQKLLPRIEGGGGGGCPVLVFGISDKLFVEDLSLEEALRLAKKAKKKEPPDT